MTAHPHSLHFLPRGLAATLQALLLLALSLPAWAAPASFGMHGMALFGGKDALYASHLPMFHAPHDYQVVIRLRLADPALDAALRQRMEGRLALWSIAPEKFELTRLAPGAADPLARFKGDIVLGHFEQGGVAQWRAAEVVVEEVIVFRQLSAAYKDSATSRYLQVGSGRQRYLVKEVDSRPDFDHIVAIRVPEGTATAPVLVAREGVRETGAAVLGKTLPGAEVRGSVYYFTGDLK